MFFKSLTQYHMVSFVIWLFGCVWFAVFLF